MKALKNNRGILTLDFLFAFVLVMGFTTLLFALTFTLSVVEVVQYFTFSSARSFNAAHLTTEAQIGLGEAKFEQLRTNPTFLPLFRKDGWFDIPTSSGIAESVAGQWNSLYPAPTARGNAKTYYGSRVLFISKLLNIDLPLLGSVGGNEKSFQTAVATFLSKEPSSQDCMSGFVFPRFEAILGLSENYAGGGAVKLEGYLPIADNGC